MILLYCKNDVNAPKKEEPSSTISGSKFEPPDGECLFILGQANNDYMEAYMNKIQKSPPPAGFAYYTSLSSGAVQNDMPKYKSFLDKYPNTMLQLAIWTGERQWGNPGYYLDDIIKGQYNRNIKGLSQSAKSLLRNYSWPGNVRQLKNAIERAILVDTKEWIEAEQFALDSVRYMSKNTPKASQKVEKKQQSYNKIEIPDAGISLERFEKDIILSALNKANGNLSKAARLLKISRGKLRYRLERLNITQNEIYALKKVHAAVAV